jgi:DNA mismatch endonuclease (patch repair protein)
LESNAERDRRNVTALSAAGWRVFVVWECEARNVIRLGEIVREIAEVTGPPRVLFKPKPPTVPPMSA